MGEILGAYAKAFDFSDFLDMEADLDEEVEELREGLAIVKLIRETRISKPWLNELIIKLYGRAIRLSFLQSKLNLLWKPFGSLGCVDLGNDFFSVRFSLKEDMDVVLKNGPWFIGGHFYPLGHGSHSSNWLVLVFHLLQFGLGCMNYLWSCMRWKYLNKLVKL